MILRKGLLAVLCLLAAAASAGEPEGALQVLGFDGDLRLFRFETEAWPLEAGLPLPDNSRVELDAGAKLRLRYANYLDFDAAGPARLTVYVVPSPAAGEFDDERVILKLDEGVLFVDGRFQFQRPADVVLSMPDRSLVLPPDGRFFARVSQGKSSFFVPLSGSARAVAPASLSNGAVVASSPPSAAPEGLVPPSLLEELDRPVRLFIVARDFDQDLGVWPRPPVLGPLLAERMAAVPGLTVVDGSGDTYFAYRANAALKEGRDPYLKELALAQGARWVLAGNCVTDTPPQESEPNRRAVRGQAEVRLMEADGDEGGLELVSEAAVTRVARAGRPMEQASRQAFEAASDEVARYLRWHVEGLLQGRSHAAVLVKLEADSVDASALEALRFRLASLDSVERVFRRSYSRKTVFFDLLLRKDVAEFDRQWARESEKDRSVGAWTWVRLPTPDDSTRRVRAVKVR